MMGREKTDKEISARIKEIADQDWLGTQYWELVCRLSFEVASPLLRDGGSGADWKECPRDCESILKEMLDYMPFAWEKAKNCRGISAGRSMDHYRAWIWLLGEEPGYLDDYEFYGKDNLVKICEEYGWDASEWDDGVRVNSELEA